MLQKISLSMVIRIIVIVFFIVTVIPVVLASKFQGDGTYTLKDQDIVRLNNGLEILVYVEPKFVELPVSLPVSLELTKKFTGRLYLQEGKEKKFMDY